MLMSLGVVQPAIDSLKAAGLSCAVYDDVEPNPTTHMCEAAYKIYRDSKCDSVIAFGGGSPMDCAKIVGALVANKKPVKDYQGMLNVTMYGLLGQIPPFIAVPTTAGTGSETTIASIITVPEERAKISVIDPGLCPHVAVMDPLILQKLPPAITAATGVDALTHAVEAYLGSWGSDFTEQNSLMAVEKIFKYLKRCYHNGDDLEAREGMLLASFEAGLAFTRANVGYVHAIAHQLGGLFHTPHGVANAMLLPKVLDFYLMDEEKGSAESACTEKFFELAKAAGIASHYKDYTLDEKRDVARQFVAEIRAMNAEMNIPQTVPQMKASDVAEVAKRALAEAHGELNGGFLNAPYKHFMDLGYPVPKHLSDFGCQSIIASTLPEGEREAWFSGPGKHNAKL